MDEQPVVRLSTRELESELLGLAGHIAAAKCRFLQLLAEFDGRGGWVGPGVRSCAHWLSWQAGMSLRTAAEHVRVAHALAKLPQVTEAFAAGRLSYSKVRAITRVTADLPEEQPDPGAAGQEGSRAGGEQAGAEPPQYGPPQPGDGGGVGAGGNRASEAGASGTGANGTGADEAGTGGVSGAGAGGVDADAGAGAGGAEQSAFPGSREPRVAPPAEVEQTLLKVALAGTASHLETVVRAVRRRTADPARAQAARSLCWTWTDEGSLVLRGRFAAAEGAILIAAIEAAVIPPPAGGSGETGVPDRPVDWRQRAVEHPPGATDDRIGARRADALLALTAAATEPDDPDDPDDLDDLDDLDIEDLDTGPHAGAAVDGGAETAAEPPESGRTRRPRRSRRPVVRRNWTKIVVHVEATTGTARIPGGPDLPPATAERLACDAQVQLLLSDTQHNRLYLGRTRRLASPAQIAALTIRDHGRCQFPGCSHTHHLHAHHIRPWWAGGRTDIDNLVLLCGFHHRLLHDHAYRIDRTPDRWRVLRPDGTEITPTTPLTGDLDSLIGHATRAGRLISDCTVTPTWPGERLDLDPVLDVLLPRPTPTTTAA